MTQDLTRADTHFAFGENWSRYAQKIDAADITEAEKGLSQLLGGERLDGKSFLDIGCGSGLHTLAAIRLGAKDVVAVDIDAASVATAGAVLRRFASQAPVRIEEQSVFELTPDALGRFDVVYSWGVLHHTGDMHRALRRAVDLVAPGGLFVFALYRRTWTDWFWRGEKRWYAGASANVQARVQAAYLATFRLGLFVQGRRLADYSAGYGGKRGMDFRHDVHDWLGGWPYETISVTEIERLMVGLDFARVRAFVRRGRLFGRDPGVLGSGCDEYIYMKPGI